MPGPTVVFVHGRAQEFKDPATLLTRWLASLNAGLTASGARPLRRREAVLPFYGNVLYRATAAATDRRVRLEALPTDEPGPVHPELPEDVDALERELVADLARSQGIPADGASRVRPEGLAERVLSWRTTRDLLRRIADRTRVDQLVIAAQLRDVAVYLTRGRDVVLDTVRAALPADGPVVLVSHSLGTVVARDLLHDDALRRRTRLWVTTGSPLGLDAVQRNLLQPGCRHPGTPWTSAYDVQDVVALGHPLRPAWGTPLQDVEVSNRSDPHSVSRYLAHAEVAGPVGVEMSDQT